jgi:hypothetical protein
LFSTNFRIYLIDYFEAGATYGRLYSNYALKNNNRHYLIAILGSIRFTDMLHNIFMMTAEFTAAALTDDLSTSILCKGKLMQELFNRIAFS